MDLLHDPAPNHVKRLVYGKRCWIKLVHVCNVLFSAAFLSCWFCKHILWYPTAVQVLGRNTNTQRENIGKTSPPQTAYTGKNDMNKEIQGFFIFFPLLFVTSWPHKLDSESCMCTFETGTLLACKPSQVELWMLCDNEVRSGASNS